MDHLKTLSEQESIYLKHILNGKSWRRSSLISRVLNKKNPCDVRYDNGFLKITIETKINKKNTVIIEVYNIIKGNRKVLPVYGKIYTPAWIITSEKINSLIQIPTRPKIDKLTEEQLIKLGHLAQEILDNLGHI